MNRKLKGTVFLIDFFILFIYINNIKVFNVTFDQFNACLLNKSINYSLLIIN